MPDLNENADSKEKWKGNDAQSEREHRSFNADLQVFAAQIWWLKSMA